MLVGQHERRAHPAWLAVEFGTCVGVWTVVTFLLAVRSAAPDSSARSITGSVLVGDQRGRP